MRIHAYYCYWIGGAVGFLVGVIVGAGICMLPRAEFIHLPAITMGTKDAR